MRQIFHSHPWVHRPAPEELVRLFHEKGRWMRLPAGAAIFNGGDPGEVALLLKGLCSFSFRDAQGANHIFSLIVPGRIMGDMDAISGEVVNVIDAALREAEVRVLTKDVFREYLETHHEVRKAHAAGTIADHESDMEGMVANFTLSAPDRIRALFYSLVHYVPSKIVEGFVEVPYGLRTVEISQIVSVARPTVSSILSTWRGEGLIRKEGHRLFVDQDFLQMFDWQNKGAEPGIRIRKRRKSSE